MNINQFHDGESVRQQRNLTASQKKATLNTKEGVLVNSFIKDCKDCPTNLEDTCDTLIISKDAGLPNRIYEKETPKEKNLLPISAVALGVMGVITLATAFVKRNARIVTANALNGKDGLPTVTRNVVLNEETHQAIYQMICSPSKKTILAGMGVLSLSSLSFMGKTFFDGFKDVWVKKKEADIQKGLQEKLIDIETQSFSGKIQITRNMLSEKAKEFSKYLSNDEQDVSYLGKKRNFDGMTFKGDFATNNNEKKSNALNYFAIGIGITAAIIGLGFLAMKNLTKSKESFNKFEEITRNLIDGIVKGTKETPTDLEKVTLDYHFQRLGASEKEIHETMAKTKWVDTVKKEFTQAVTEKINSSTTQVDKAMGGSGIPKPAFLSHVDDYRAFFYNWLLDTNNKQFQQLFFGITGLTAFGYGGKLVGDAVKDIEVKKMNAQTEVELQNRLISTELRNFKAKKDASIQPLTNEFYRQVSLGKPKEELKTMADNILFEVKNGPPFVYS